MSQGYVTTRAATVNLNGTSDTGTVVTGGNVGGSPVFMTYIPSVTGLFPVEAANFVWAGPATGSAALPTFRALVAADIPAIPQSGVTGLVAALASKATDSLVVHLAGVESITGVKTFTANPVFNAGGIPNASVAGLAASATTDTTNAANISSGTLPSARLVGAYTGVTGLGTLSALTNFTTGVQLNALAKLLPTSIDGVAQLWRSDGATPTSSNPTGLALNGSSGQGVELYAYGNGDFRVFGFGKTDNATLRVSTASITGSIFGQTLHVIDGSGNNKNTLGYVTANNGVNTLQVSSANGVSSSAVSDGAVFRSLYTEARPSSNFSSGGGFSCYSDSVVTNSSASVTMTLPAPLGKGRVMHFAISTGGGTFTVASATGSQIYKTAGAAAVASIASTSGVGAYILLGDFDGTGWTIMAQTGTWA